MRFIYAIARVWLSILGCVALTAAIAGALSLPAIMLHGIFGVPAEPLAAVVFGLTLVTTGAVVVEWRRG